MKLRTFVCERCSTTFERQKGKRTFRFCSKSCAAKTVSVNNFSYDGLYKRWSEKYGHDEALLMLEKHRLKRSAATSGKNNPRYNAVLSPETKEKISSSCTGIPNVLKGKTFEEFYGPDKAKSLASDHSKKLKEGYASGKIKPTARSCSAPVFRGVRLRSQLEQRAIEWLEKRDGLVFGQTLLYEDPATFVQWVDERGTSHTYVPDLHDTVNKVIYEVKPARFIDNPTSEMQRKMAALRAVGHSAAYISDRDVRRQ